VQSETSAHVELHALPAQPMYPRHAVVPPPWVHAPAPSHVIVAINWAGDPLLPGTQVGGEPQGVPATQSSQAPPLHLPSVPQVEAASAVHTLRGSGAPSAAGLHTPVPPPPACWSDASHAMHAPVHGPSQQTPSTQEPVAH
jgi:hypothetical protein